MFDEAKKLKKEGLNEFFLRDEVIIGRYLAEDIIYESTGEKKSLCSSILSTVYIFSEPK